MFGGIKHTDPGFWRHVLAFILLACGGVLIGDGVIRWALDQANSSIPAGCCSVFLGIIVLLGKKAQPAAGELKPDTENADTETP